jgi:hypothetical protein
VHTHSWIYLLPALLNVNGRERRRHEVSTSREHVYEVSTSREHVYNAFPRLGE